jgi:hypothetical protein
MAWRVRYYKDLDTKQQPAKDWLKALYNKPEERPKWAAAMAAIHHVLKQRGTDVCESEWGKNLGKGLYEFRVRNPADQIQSKFPLRDRLPKDVPAGKGPVTILLRIFFMTYGKEVILLLCGYDKDKDPRASKQSEEIERAREMVNKARANLRARLKGEARGKTPDQRR